MSTPADTCANVVGALTAHVHDGLAGCLAYIYAIPADELRPTLALAIGELAHQITLGCAESKMSIDEYLPWLGLAIARGDT